MRTVTRHWSAAARVLLVPAVATWAAGCATPDEQRPVDSERAPAGAVTNAVPGAGAAAEPLESAVTATPPAPLPPPPPARDADQAFLRAMLDHHEAMITRFHARMMEPAGHAAHGSATDPADLDAKLDADRQQMLLLLAQLYGEQYSARPEPPAAAAARPARPAPPAGGGRGDAMMGRMADMPAMTEEMAAQHRASVAIVDRYLPRLTRPDVRTLARQIRATQLGFARQMSDTSAAH